MRIVIFGLAVSSTWGNGHGALWRALIGALAKDGHAVTFFERDAPYYAQHRDLTALPGGGTLVLYSDWSEALAQARRSLAEADVGHGHVLLPGRHRRDGAGARQHVPVRCFYDLDTPVTLARLAAGEQTSYIGPDGLAGLRPGAELHRRRRAGRAAATARRAARRRRSTAGSIRSCIARRRRTRTTLPRCPISAPMRRTGRRRWSGCSSSRRGGCPPSGS